MTETEWPVPDRLRLEAGRYEVEVLGAKRDEEEGEYGARYNVGVRYEGLERTIRASESLWQQMYALLVRGDRTLLITVVGAGRDTRYAVEAME
jgi:hypothetical protein